MREVTGSIEPNMNLSDSDVNDRTMAISIGSEVCVPDVGEMTNLSEGRDVDEMNANREPCVGMEFESEEAAMAYYDAYANHTGFVIRVGSCHRSSQDGSVIDRKFLCNREGFSLDKKTGNRLVVRKRKELTREGCEAMILVKKEKSGKWVVTRVKTEHNHALGIPPGKGRRGTLQDDKDKRIRELSAELQRTKQQLATCRKQLEMFLTDIECCTNHLDRKIQDVVRNVKSFEDGD